LTIAWNVASERGEIERPVLVPPDEVARLAGQRMGEIGAGPCRFLTVKYAGHAAVIDLREIGNAGVMHAVEFVEAAFERSEFRRRAAMPFAEQAGAIALLPEIARQGWKFRLQPDIVAMHFAQDRLEQASGMARGIAPGHQRQPRRRTRRGAGITVHELHALFGHAVEMRRREIRPSVTGQIGPAEIVGEDEDDIGGRCTGHASVAARDVPPLAPRL
jgi:hypothetical protein